MVVDRMVRQAWAKTAAVVKLGYDSHGDAVVSERFSEQTSPQLPDATGSARHPQQLWPANWTQRHSSCMRLCIASHHDRRKDDGYMGVRCGYKESVWVE